MNFARKIKRKNLHKTSCCGHQMLEKYVVGNKKLYVCDKCGKSKWVEVEK